MKNKDRIFELIEKLGKFTSKEITKTIGVSRQYVNQVISELITENRVVKIGKTRGSFYLFKDFDLDKTEIRVRLFTSGGVHISRSQARRILAGLEKFKVILLDYENVPIVGQAFADEIYRVFQNSHSDIIIQEENMSEGVKFMVERAKNEAKNHYEYAKKFL